MTVYAFQADLFWGVMVGTANVQTLGVKKQDTVPDQNDAWCKDR